MDVGSSFVYVTFITDCCKLSPDQGIHAASIGYPVNESDTTTVDNGGSGSGGTGGQQDDDLGAELLPSTPYLTGFDENVTRTMTGGEEYSGEYFIYDWLGLSTEATADCLDLFH